MRDGLGLNQHRKWEKKREREKLSRKGEQQHQKMSAYALQLHSAVHYHVHADKWGLSLYQAT